MRRVNVIGRSGSGKTSVARALATKLGAPVVELDELHWDRYPNWQIPPLDEFRGRVDEATRAERWVVDGSYGKVRDIVWSRADTVVWLDIPFAQCLARVLWRTFTRSRSRERLWGVQEESLRNALVGRDALVPFILRTEPRRGRVYREWLARPEYAHLRLVRLRTQREIDDWLVRIYRT